MFALLRRAVLASLTLAALGGCSSVEKRDVTRANVENAYDVLQQWYDQGAGVYKTGYWWSSANCITVIGGLAQVDHSKRGQILSVIENSFHRAQGGNFIDQHSYDDEAWWALAWIKAFDLTGDHKYLNVAINIYNDMASTFGKTRCSRNKGGVGGIWWDHEHTYVNAIPNALFLSIGAHLANRDHANKKNYIKTAEQQWRWFRHTAMWNSRGTINDGLNRGLHGTPKNCESTEDWESRVWSYNQGVVIGALVELSKATRKPHYVDVARDLADATIAQLAPGGILTERCDHDFSCNADQTQFKGIFARNLVKLYHVRPRHFARYKAFLHNNANSIWARDRNQHGQLGLVWKGPIKGQPNASTHSSALDCLVASLKA